MTRDTIAAALPALLVALAGVGIAWLLFYGRGTVAIAAVLVVTATGWLGDRAGRRALPARPVRARLAMELYLLVPISLASFVAGLLIWLAVYFAEDKSWSQEKKELIAATAGALTTFLSSAFIKGIEDADEKGVAVRIRNAFREAYEAPDSIPDPDVRRRLFDLNRSWSRQKRKELARAIQDVL